MWLPPDAVADVRAVLFDLDNTLIDRNEAFRICLGNWLSRFAPSVRAEQYPTEIGVIMQQDDWGYADRTDFCAWLKERYEVELPVNAVLGYLLANIPRGISAEPLVLDLLHSLGSRYTLGLVSNGSGKTQRAKMKQAGLDAIFEEKHVHIEGEVGCAKPHVDIFARAVARLGLPPERVLFVGDHPVHDVAGAAKAGMKTCWLAQGRTFPQAMAEPDCVIDDLLQLSSLFAHA